MADENDRILYLDSDAIANLLPSVDVVAIIRQTLVQHEAGDTLLPDESYLRWTPPTGGWARSLCLAAALEAPAVAAGVKIINGNPDNPVRRLPRASGLLLLFDVETARIKTIMVAEEISAVRTAAISIIACSILAPTILRRCVVIGAGPIGTAHAKLMCNSLGSMTDLMVYDAQPERSLRALESIRATASSRDIRIAMANNLHDALKASDIIIAATTSTEPYIDITSISPGSVVVNVGLDDCTDSLILGADILIVDSWDLVKKDQYRAAGRLYHEGLLVGPQDVATGAARQVTAELPTIVSNPAGLEVSPDARIVVNPFGMAISDVAVAAAIDSKARSLVFGSWLNR